MEEDEFQALFEATRGPLRAYLLRAGGKEAANADDLLQETYIRLFNHPPRALDPATVRSWLFTTATRLLRDQWRRDRVRSWLPWRGSEDDEEADAGMPMPCADPPPDRRAWATEAVGVGFAALTPRQRSLLWLAYVEGFDHAELARALGIAKGSVKVLLHRARERMNEALRPLGWEEASR